jgi:pectin methylesterase-like acyl-CoA thioesterase
MKSIFALGSLLTLLLASLATPALAAPATAGGPSIIVDDNLRCAGAHFSTIQSAVDAAPPGTTIRVCPGTYSENVRITTPLTLVGKPESQAIVHGTIVVTGADVTCPQSSCHS